MGLILWIAVLVVTLLYALRRLLRKTVVSDLPGPEPESFWLGNLPELFQPQAGVTDFKWQDQYGGVVHIKAPFGEDMLVISDPKALQYIYQTSGYNFPKQPERRILSRLVADNGLTWAEGETHKRQRKVMLPAFGTPESKNLLPVFRHYAEQVTLKWKDLLAEVPEQSCIFNVPKYIAPATLEAIGEAAFDYKLGVFENSENELAKAYNNLVATIFSAPSTTKIFMQNLTHYIPMSILEVLYDHLPGKGLDKARKGNRDIMSILVNSNASENGQARLSHKEMISQMRTILLAGQETTSNTLSFALLELARHPWMQTRLRAEIRDAERALFERGASEFTVADLEAIPYLQAVLKEVLRFHPVVPHNFRQSLKDDVLPLSKPITTRSGKVIHELPIRAGLRLVLSVAAYNRDKDVWGDDAHTFNPERWLEFKGKRGPTVGVIAILTFAGGLRACIGWRFAVYEVQAFLLELVSNFEFGLCEDLKRLRREQALVMVPTLEGEVEKGVQLPLRVSLAPREE
ncbi:11-oxo-beta-amyrin 30-oxidase [Grifola frondosa]|uniref:11-oxo-beta-amyrin 30-oxidase n=1 Tax=Grifola frondosa TaxID=5627 RepID=A0A1C7LZ96_GRIFR|nr:11-oxo-beta-amyrin 30-oxidase [Grifola frondosa]